MSTPAARMVSPSVSGSPPWHWAWSKARMGDPVNSWNRALASVYPSAGSSGGSYQSMSPGQPLVPGQFYDVTFDLEPDDHVIPAGKQLGVMIMSSDPEFTLLPEAGARLTVDAAGTSIAVPVVGGLEALTRAGAVRPLVP